MWTVGRCIVYTGIRLLLLIIAPLWKSWGYAGFALSFRNLSSKNFSLHFSIEPWGLEDWNFVHTWTVNICIMYTRIRLLLFIPLFLHFSFQFSDIKNFRHFCQELWILEDWNLVHTWTVGRCILFIGIRLLLLIHPFISSVFFLSNFQTLQIFVTLFSGTVRPRRLKLGAHVDSGWLCSVYWNQAAAAYLSHLFLNFSFSPIFKLLNFFVTLFAGTVRPRRWKLGTHMDSM